MRVLSIVAMVVAVAAAVLCSPDSVAETGLRGR